MSAKNVFGQLPLWTFFYSYSNIFDWWPHYLVLFLNVLFRGFTVAAEELLDGAVSEVVDELEDGDEVVPVGVALPVAFSLHKGFLKIQLNHIFFIGNIMQREYMIIYICTLILKLKNNY